MESLDKNASAGREYLRDKKRIVVKVGSSSITHAETGRMNLEKIEKLVRVLSDLANQAYESLINHRNPYHDAGIKNGSSHAE